MAHGRGRISEACRRGNIAVDGSLEIQMVSKIAGQKRGRGSRMNPTNKSRRWLNSLASVLVLLTVVGSGAWVLTDDDATAETIAYNPTSALPANVLFHLSYDGANASKNCRQLALAELWQEKQVQQFVSPIVNWANGMIDDMSKDLAEDIGMSIDDLATLGRSHTTMTLVGVEMAEKGPPMIDLIVTLDLGSNNEVLGRLQAAVDRLMKEEMHAEVKMLDLGGVVVRGCEVEGIDVMWTAMGSHLIIGTQVKTMAEVLTRMKAKTSTGGLMENASFAMARDKVAPGNDAVVFAYANVDGIVKTVEAAMPDEEEISNFISMFGIDQIRDYSYAINFEGRAVVDRIWVATPREKHGIMAATRSSNEPLKSLMLAPKDSFFYSATRIDLASLANDLLSVVKEIEPQAHEEVTGMMEELNSKLGFSILGDLLPNLGDEWAMWAGKAPYGSLIPEIIMTVQVKDKAKVAACVTNAKEKFGADALVRSFSFMGRELNYCDLGKIFARDQFGFGLKPCWMMDGDTMFVALAPQTLKNYVASQSNQRESLMKNADVGNAMAHFKRYNPNAANCSFSYFDIASFIVMAADTASPLLQSVNFPKEAMMGLEVDFNMFPTGDVFRRHLFGFSSASSVSDQGMSAVMHSPFGYMGMIMAIAVPVGAGTAFAASRESNASEWEDLEPVEIEEEPAEKQGEKKKEEIK